MHKYACFILDNDCIIVYSDAIIHNASWFTLDNGCLIVYNGASNISMKGPGVKPGFPSYQ